MAASKTTADMITQAALDRFADTPDPRAREIIVELVRALHGFARKVKLTPQEMISASELLTWAGQISDDKRHEFILWSDTLGLTMLLETMADDLPEGAYEPSVLGPFYREGAPQIHNYGSISRGKSDGEPVLVSGQVRGIDGEPIGGAELDIWQTNINGFYENVDPEQPDFNLRGRLHSDENGHYAFWTVKPVSYPIPIDGPVGVFLKAVNRHHWRPAHIHFIVSADGYKTVTSELFTRDDPYIDGDAVFGVKQSLLVDYVEADEPELAAKHGMPNPFQRMHYDFVLAKGTRDKLAFSADR